MANSDPPVPNHVKGAHKGEEAIHDRGQEPGREKGRVPYRTARDATSLNPEDRDPIAPGMPSIPPA